MGHASRPLHLSIDSSAAVDLITESRNPTLIIDAIDLAGAAAAVNLAKVANMRLDHAAQEHLTPLQELGFLGTMPGEAGLRADMVLWIGATSHLIETDEAARRLLFDQNNLSESKKTPRKHLCIAAPGQSPAESRIKQIPLGDRPVLDTLGLLRARVKAQPTALDTSTQDDIDGVVAELKSAKYGVAVFAAGRLSFLEQTNLMALIDDLSSETRWTLLPMDQPVGQAELARMTLALTGLITPLAFLNGRARHDGYFYGAEQSIARGETDLVIWLSSSTSAIPTQFLGAPNTIAITAHDTAPSGVDTHIRIGIPGVDHSAILEPAELACAVAITPSQTNSAHPTAADVLYAIAEHATTKPEVAA